MTYAMLQDARDANIIYLGTNLGVYRSTDRGTSWAPVWAIEKKKAPARKTTRTTKATAAVAPKRLGAPTSTATIMQAQEALTPAGYHLGDPDGKPGPATTAAVKKFQDDRHLPITGKLDAITLAALGVRKTNDPTAAEKADLILPDAVYALVHTVDPNTQSPAILAATNSGLYRSVDPTKGWLKLSYGSFDSH